MRRRSIEAHRKPHCIIVYSETRFAGVYYLIKRLLFLRTILREISMSAGFEQRRYAIADDIIGILTNNTLWTNFDKLRLFLKPLKCFIKLMDHDCHCTHHEYPGMHISLYDISLIYTSMLRYVDRRRGVEQE